MNFGVWGVQVFITYFFISYIYYVLYIKRVYENHMMMCDRYIMLTFFISMRLVNRNNCVASKLTQIYYMYTPGRYAEDFLRIPARRVCAWRMEKRSSYEWHAKSGMVRDTDTYYEYKTPIYKFIAYENNFARN